MHQRLKHRYFRWLLPALTAGIGLLILGQTAPGAIRSGNDSLGAWMPGLFFLAVVASLAGPVVVRLVFAHRARKVRQVGRGEYFRFRIRLIHTAMIPPYLALPALATGSSGFFQCGTFLAALYAVYYGYPSRERVEFDRRLFRVEAGS